MILADFVLDAVETSLQAVDARVHCGKSGPHLRTKVVDSLTQALAHATDTEAYDLLQPVLPQAKEASIVGDWHDYKSLVVKPGAIDPRVFDDSLRRLKDVGIIAGAPAADTLYANQTR